MSIFPPKRHYPLGQDRNVKKTAFLNEGEAKQLKEGYSPELTINRKYVDANAVFYNFGNRATPEEDEIVDIFSDDDNTTLLDEPPRKVRAPNDGSRLSTIRSTFVSNNNLYSFEKTTVSNNSFGYKTDIIIDSKPDVTEDEDFEPEFSKLDSDDEDSDGDYYQPKRKTVTRKTRGGISQKQRKQLNDKLIN